MAIAANKYLSSEEGKKTRQNFRKILADFYNFVVPKIRMVKNISQAKYRQIIMEAAEEYGRSREISSEMVDELIEKTLDMWDDFLEKMEK